MSKKQPNNSKYIEQLYMNGLHGRMLRLRGLRGKSKEILVIYGQHSSLEQVLPWAKKISKYGTVTVPDLPGFGGMHSFYRLGEKPSLDNLADYLASFIKVKYKHRRITIVGVAFGFVVVTRMLQKFPEIVSKVDLLISLAGFVHKDDLVIKQPSLLAMRYGSSVFSRRLPAWFVKNVFLRPIVLRCFYLLSAGSDPRLSSISTELHDQHAKSAIELWRKNDMRTYMATTSTILKLDICNAQVKLPVHHVYAAGDRFNAGVTEQHLEIIFDDVHMLASKLPRNRKNTLLEYADNLPILPRKVLRLLAK